MSVRTTLLIVLTLFALAALASWVTLQWMPERVVTHWNAQGQPDGYSTSGSNFIIPVMLLGTALLMLFLPRLDPLRSNIAAFGADYNSFVVGMAAFLFLLHAVTLAINLGWQINLLVFMSLSFAALLYGSGVLIGKARRNYFIGIRTPWTLHSDTVWQKTHRRGAWLFKLAGVICLLGLLWPPVAFFFLIAPVLLISVYLMVYSYLLYRRETTQQQ